MLNYNKFLTKKYLIYLYGICSFAFKATIIIIPMLTQKIVDSAIGNNFNNVFYYGVISLITALLFIILMYSISKIMVLLYGEIDYALKKELANRISFGNYTKIKEKEIGYYLQRHNTDIDQLRFLYFEKNIDLVVNVLFFIGIFIAMIRINLMLSVCLLITVPVFIFLNKYFIPKIESNAHVYLNNEEKLNSDFEIIYNNEHAARSMKVMHHLFNKYNRQNLKTRQSMLAYYLLDEKYNAIVVNGILNICNTIIYFFGAILIMKGTITVGSLLAIAIYFARIWSPIEFFLGFKKKVSKSKVSEQRINQVLNLSSNEKNYLQDVKRFDLLEIKNIRFSYNKNRIFDAESLILENNNLYYVKGQNGCGKTTLFDMISGVINSNIKLSIDNHEIKDITSFLKTNIFYIPSELFLIEDFNFFSQDVIDHICHNREKIDFNELSAGEKRIIQISSALKRPEKVIIIDEPLNYIGGENIEYILSMIEKVKQNRIVLISSHNEIIEKISDKHIFINNKKILFN